MHKQQGTISLQPETRRCCVVRPCVRALLVLFSDVRGRQPSLLGSGPRSGIRLLCIKREPPALSQWQARPALHHRSVHAAAQSYPRRAAAHPDLSRPSPSVHVCGHVRATSRPEHSSTATCSGQGSHGSEPPCVLGSIHYSDCCYPTTDLTGVAVRIEGEDDEKVLHKL